MIILTNKLYFQVISIDGNSASVRFIDYGNSEVKKLEELYR